MKLNHLSILGRAIEQALEQISEDGNPHYTYEKLSEDMTHAAAMVYDACMRGQDAMEENTVESL